jgi:signal transduction histidine kinase
MPERIKRINIVAFKKEVKAAQAETLAAIRKIEAEAKKSGNKDLTKLCALEKKRVLNKFVSLLTGIQELQLEFKNEIRKGEIEHKKTINALEHLKDTAASDNILLEYKKKDLQLKAHELENAYDELSARNKELIAQKQLIGEQAEKLKIAHTEIMEKNSELEAKTESLLDQSDYLHEANEAITNMHKKLELQQNEILQKNEELLNLNNEKNNLIGIVAHDLKSPLNQIKGLVSIIKMTSALEGEAVGYLQLIENSAARLNTMIAKILDIEAIESRQLNLTLEPLNLSGVVQAISSRYALEAERKKIKLHHSIDNDVIVYADQNYIDQVIENLLSNAVKFSPSNKNIFINVSVADGKALCEIRDEGPGLSEDDKKKLFSKYQKLSARPTGDETSTGLGLSIVKKFVEAMRGEIWCESEASKGASFFVRFERA